MRISARPVSSSRVCSLHLCISYLSTICPSNGVCVFPSDHPAFVCPFIYLFTCFHLCLHYEMFLRSRSASASSSFLSFHPSLPCTTSKPAAATTLLFFISFYVSLFSFSTSMSLYFISKWVFLSTYLFHFHVLPSFVWVTCACISDPPTSISTGMAFVICAQTPLFFHLFPLLLFPPLSNGSCFEVENIASRYPSKSGFVYGCWLVSSRRSLSSILVREQAMELVTFLARAIDLNEYTDINI